MTYYIQKMELYVFVKNKYKDQITQIEAETKATGFANVVANKGGVMISFFLGNTSFCFIDCHLAAGINKIPRRNNDYYNLVRYLRTGNKKLDPTF
jgi:hypothetical protein